jgi:hypothetical protein
MEPWAELNRDLGLAGMKRDRIHLDRIAGVEKVQGIVPEVELREAGEGTELVQLGWSRVRTEWQGLVEAFVRLHGAPDEAYVRFAGKWGMLGLCEGHHLPATHVYTRRWPVALEDHQLNGGPTDRIGAEFVHWVGGFAWCLDSAPLIEADGDGNVPKESICPRWNSSYLNSRCWSEQRSDISERLADWRFFAAAVVACLRIAANLNRQTPKPGKREDWEAVFARFGIRAPWWHQSVRTDRLTLAAVLNDWLDMADARPRVSWPQDRPSPLFDIRAAGLFGVLVRELVFTCSKLDGFVLCSACGVPFQPRRKPQAGRNCFCSACGTAAAWRMSKRRQRAQNASA